MITELEIPLKLSFPVVIYFYLFGVLPHFNTVQVISQRVVVRAEETSTYSS